MIRAKTLALAFTIAALLIPVGLHAADKGEIRKQQVIRLILAHTVEYYIHNLNGADGNSVIVSGDGHEETVINPESGIVKDCANKGSYNLFHPSRQPLMHFSADILPWLRWGNCPDDPTTTSERLKGYLKDLERGLQDALSQKAELDNAEAAAIDQGEQKEAVAFFLAAMQESKDDSVFRFFDQKAKAPSDKQIESFLKNLATGMAGVLK